MKLTALDSKEIPRYTYDEENNAQRVTIVDFGIAEAIKEQLKDLKIELPVQQPLATMRMPEPIIVKEYLPGEVRFEQIQVPIIVKEIEYREIQVPVIQHEVRVIEIEKPIIQKEIVTVEVPVIVKQIELQMVYVDRLNYKMLFILQLLTFGLIVISKFIK